MNKIIRTTDKKLFRISDRIETPEGYLKVPGKVARTGIQEYLPSEVGHETSTKPILKIYRPPAEVFKQETLDSYNGSDVTIEHPDKGFVDNETWTKDAVGVVLNARQENEFVVADLIIKDKDAIDAVNSGKVQLSAGYTNEYDFTPGITPDGEEYDGIQKNITINHVALVNNARAGNQARINDSGDKLMDKVKVTLDSGVQVEVEDKSTATLIEQTIERLRATNDSNAETIKKLKTTNDSQTKEISELKVKTNDEAIKNRLVEIQKVKEEISKKVKDFTCDSLEPVEIKRAALVKITNDSEKFKDKSPEYINAFFDAQPELKEEEVKEITVDSNPVFGGYDPTVKIKTKDSEMSAYEKSKVDLADQWKKTLENK